MPEGNVQRVRQGYEVLNRGEVDRFLTEFVHPEYEFHTGVRVPSIPTVVRGRDGLRAWIEQWYQEYAHIITVREGLCVRVDGFASWKQALSAAGLGD